MALDNGAILTNGTDPTVAPGAPIESQIGNCCARQWWNGNARVDLVKVTYQSVRTAYCAISSSGVRIGIPWTIDWQINMRSNGSPCSLGRREM